MLKLTSPSDEPSWLDLVTGVRIRVRPATVAAIVVAQTAAGKVFRADETGADPDAGSKASVALVCSLAHFAIVEWEGVGDEAGELAAVTPENVEALMRVWPAYDAFDRRYATPALSLSAEKTAEGTGGLALRWRVRLLRGVRRRVRSVPLPGARAADRRWHRGLGGDRAVWRSGARREG